MEALDGTEGQESVHSQAEVGIRRFDCRSEPSDPSLSSSAVVYGSVMLWLRVRRFRQHKLPRVI
jgi:hypothetical protein